ncbi:MAG: class I SAM-dependent methyltransferase [Candidatus Omnitrophota bacterium]|nr:class I SAM-dependent methyltransferase [Candidatus Omnitrophota bacterium]
MGDKEKLSVKQANKLLYDTIKDNYEKIDGRRSRNLLSWLRNRLEGLSIIVNEKSVLLDIGCGSGFVIKAAQGLFKRLYGLDISENILKKVSQFADGVICADVDFIPLKDETIDIVVLFSAIHHFYDFRVMLDEIHHVLKKGGILYIDHDLDKRFAKRFKLLLKIYRRVSRRKDKYISAGIDERIYDLAEFHSDGIDKQELEHCLKELGFEIIDSFNHWFGLSRFTNKIFGYKKFCSSSAPLLSIVARKVSIE